MSGFNKRSRLSSSGSGKPSTAQPGSAESDKKASGPSPADSGNARGPTKKLKWSMNDLMNKLDNPDAPLADAKAAVEIAAPPAPTAKKATEEKPIVTVKKAVESVVPEARKATEKTAPEAKKPDSKPKDDGKRKQEGDITPPVTDWAEPAPVQGGDWESAKTGSSDSWAEPAGNKDPVWAPVEEGASPQWAEATSEKKDDLWGKSAGGEIPSTWEEASTAEVKDSESDSAVLWGESKSIPDVADETTVPNSWEEMEGGVSGWDDSGSKVLGDRPNEEKPDAEPTGAKAEKGGSPADENANRSIDKEDVPEVPTVEWEEPKTTASQSDWQEPTTKPVPSIPKAAGAASILSASAKGTVSQAVSLGTEGIARVAREAEKRDAEHIEADTPPSQPVEPVAQAAPVAEVAPVEAKPEPVSEVAAKSNDVVSTEDDLAPEPVSESKAEVLQAPPAIESSETQPIVEAQPIVEEVAAEPAFVSEAVAVEEEPVAKETAIEAEPTKEDAVTVQPPEIEAAAVEPVSDEKPEAPNAATEEDMVKAEPVSSASTATPPAPKIEETSLPTPAAQSVPPAVPSSTLNQANQNETSMMRITPADLLGSAPPPPPAPVKKSILGAAAMLMKKAAAKKSELIEGHAEPVKSAAEPVKSTAEPVKSESTAESAVSSSSPTASEPSPPETVAATLPPLPALPNIEPGVQMETGKFNLSTLQENIDARAKEVAAAAGLVSPTPSPKPPSQFEPTAQSEPPSQFDKVDIAFQKTEQDLEAMHKPESEPSSQATAPEPAQATPAESPNAVPSARPERPVDRPSSLGSSVLGKMAAAVPIKPQPEPTDESDEEGANKGGLLPDMLRHKTSLPGHSAHPLRPAPVRIKAKELRKKASKEAFRHTRLLYSASAALLLVCTAWMGYSIYDKLSSIDRVKNAFEAKHYEDAMQEIDNAMVRFPNESSLYLYKGKLLSLQHKQNDALEALSRAQALEPENPEVLKERAAVYASEGKYKLASADLSKIMLNPSMATPEVAALLGSIELRMGEFGKAWSDYHHASQMDPANDSYKVNVAASSIGQGDYKSAIEECDKILKKNPRDANALANKGYALYKQKHQDKGLEIINKSISVKPTAYAYFYRGLIKADHRKPADSAQDFALARKFDPNNPLIIRAQVQSLASSGKRAKAIDELANLQGSAGSQEIESERASIAMADGKYKQAADEYAKILAQKPDDVKVRLKHAECCEKAGEFTQAAEDYTKLLEKSSNSVQYYVKRAVVYNKEKQYTLSENDIEHAVGINPNDPQIYLARASISEGQKHFQEALVDVDHALRLAPTNELAIKKEHELGKYRPPAEKPPALPPPPPHITKTGDPLIDGYHYMQIGDVSNAIENFAKAIRKDPNNKVARRYLAYALLGKGQTAEALVQFRALLAMHAFTEEDEAKYVDLLARTGKKDDAIAFCQSCLTANPNLGLLKLALGRLYLDRDQVDQAAEALKGCTVKSAEDYRKLQELNDDIQNRINIRQLQVNPGAVRRN